MFVCHCAVLFAVTAEDLEASRQASRDMHQALRARKEALEEQLRMRTEELRELCLKEGAITGDIPFEYPLSPGEPLPQVPRRIETKFTLNKDFLLNKEKDDESQIAKLEVEFDLQDKITQAALKLAKDPTVAKSVRKKRKQSYHKSHQKVHIRAATYICSRDGCLTLVFVLVFLVEEH